jgi:orotidine-5'-phosphate decarboxylase
MASKLDEKSVIVALDFPSARQALEFSARLDAAACRVKVGKELFTREGPEIVAQLMKRGFGVFLDLKFHDIPNTVAQACRAVAAMGVWMLNVHALGGEEMLDQAKRAVADAPQRPLLVGVTLLTSLSQTDLDTFGWPVAPEAAVLRLAQLSKRAGLDGALCSAQEAPALRRALGDGFLLVAPGIRLDTSSSDDQKRVATPAEAVRNGVDYLVVGRPITRADDPGAVLQAILEQVEEARCA